MSDEAKSIIFTVVLTFVIIAGALEIQSYQQKELEKRTYNVEKTVNFKVTDKRRRRVNNVTKRYVYLKCDNLEIKHKSTSLYWDVEIGDSVPLKAKLYYDNATGDLVEIQIKD